MSKYTKISNLVLRFGLAATYIFSGTGLLFKTDEWSAYAPSWLIHILPFDVSVFLKIQGGAELLFALAFITGILVLPAALLAALEILSIMLVIGIDTITFRDMAIFGAALSLFFDSLNKLNNRANS